jgi:hypothetical protein
VSIVIGSIFLVLNRTYAQLESISTSHEQVRRMTILNNSPMPLNTRTTKPIRPSIIPIDIIETVTVTFT